MTEFNLSEKDKFILDACCGPRFMWVNKNHPNCIYIDVRKEDKGFQETRPNQCINPDFIMDFRDLPIEWNNKFKLIVWDPPHLLGKNYKSRITKSFGFLLADSWRDDFKKGFNNLWRCLEDYGVLIFKFNDASISFKEVLNQFHKDPLFQNTIANKKTGNKEISTKWFCFMKIPEEKLK